MSQPAGWSQHQGVSLLDGWFPLTVQIVAVVLLVVAIGWRTRRWRLIWLPASVAVAVIGAFLVHLYFDSQGLATDPAPRSLWIWVGVTAGALGVVVFGWRSARWWRRGVAIAVVPIALLATGIVLNQWVGYFPTVSAAWGEITSGPLPDQVSADHLASMRNTTRTTGALVSVTTPDTSSHFAHRTEYVYLPPTWFAGATPPRLPVVMMIAGEFNTPADWIRTGDAIHTVDSYAAAHHGSAPVMVFVDAGGSFNNDTECVNGSRGNVADHLTDEVRPYVISHFHTSSAAANWGIVGWSMGGTCSVDLTVMHPDLFSSYVDIAGDAAPTAGTTAQTLSRLYGGNAATAASFDPATVMHKHGPYQGISAWYDDTGGNPQGSRRPGGAGGGGGGHRWKHSAQSSGTGLGGRGEGPDTDDQGQAAQTLCAENKTVGIACQIHTQPGKHSWQFATSALSVSLPWLASTIRVPGA
ncbi:alpha/beta hydrolase [Williamsia maris]|uniref:S-formylglutathione hydrolase FrmB n=1 Tax=Williamsia maris TaxID=72806 RepID=A0ABT1HFM2_9NOCA|nr:alpha/beta hydrolase-fold protein [Williamsia maris]MCP2175770.1 S-formylglutathione hydrolase FrmB [Williamsia maris]